MGGGACPGVCGSAGGPPGPPSAKKGPDSQLYLGRGGAIPALFRNPAADIRAAHRFPRVVMGWNTLTNIDSAGTSPGSSCSPRTEPAFPWSVASRRWKGGRHYIGHPRQRRPIHSLLRGSGGPSGWVGLPRGLRVSGRAAGPALCQKGTRFGDSFVVRRGKLGGVFPPLRRYQGGTPVSAGCRGPEHPDKY